MQPLDCQESVEVNFFDDKILYHFTWIKRLSALLCRQLSRYKGKKYICERCLNYFTTQALLDGHFRFCANLNNSAVKLPKEADKNVEFKNHHYQEPVPFVIYADVESILRKCEDSQTQEKTFAYQEHEPFSIAYYLHCSYDNSLSKFNMHRGIGCIKWFVEELRNIAVSCNRTLNFVKPMQNLTFQQIREFTDAEICHVCKKDFLPNDVKVRDHNHLTGLYRGAAHNSCNLNYKDSHIIPVVFHNLSGYDAHFIIKELASGFEGNVKLLPINKERYISFTKSVSGTNIHLRFIDSFRFMASSIEKLSGYLDRTQKIITRSHCQNDEEFDLVTRKGVFPYEYVDCWEKLDETSLPTKDAFYSELRGEECSNNDYQHAINVWQKFNLNNLGEYSDLYLRTDVLLLADIFQNFRQTCINTYKLDPLHYYTAPGLAFDAMLKTTGVRLELLTDIDQVLFVERGIRGGVSQCSNRYAKANNKYMRKGYDSSKASQYLMYFDVNNLYGHAMSQSLPYAEFKFLDDYKECDILATADDSEYGYIIECDLEYPEHLHSLHSDLPLAPEHMVPPLSTSKHKKLLLTLYDKKNYVVHYRNLKMYLNYGMKLTKIHRVLQFKQSTWLKSYIDLNTSLRKQSKNEFEKNFFKLMNNSVFGKCMENVRKHKDIRLVTKWEGQWGVQSLVSKPNFHSSVIFGEDMAIIEMDKLEVCINKPIYVGFSILDISKTFLYEFHYEYILKQFPGRVKLLYTDTDSLIYLFTVEDIYEEIKHDPDRFDTSDYAPDNPYGIKLLNKKVLGLMKDENNGKIMLEFVGLRSKMYAILVDAEKNFFIKKSKGVNASAMRKITLDDYKNCLFSRIVLQKDQNFIRSHKHSVYTVRQRKVALSPYDDKRILRFPNTDTRPWGFVSHADEHQMEL